jgi:predicted RNA binding protein YcfA (HicA-like mRNA interferase family)
MKIPRDLSGADLVKILCKNLGYRLVHQVGSQIVLETDAPVHHRLSVPEHDHLRVGTLNSILLAVAKAKGISKSELLKFL